MASKYLLLPYGSAYLRLTLAEFNTILARGLDDGGIAAPALPLVTPDRLLNSRELAERLGVSADLCEQKAKTGEWPSVRVGRYLRFDPADVLAAVARGNSHD
jgi:excisionase family DNA binding protein